VLVVIHRDTQLPQIAGTTAKLTSDRMTQQASNFCMELSDQAGAVWLLIFDQDMKLTASFDSVFAAEDIRVIVTSGWAPRANAICECVIGTVRRECLERILILGRRHLEAVLPEYVDHHNLHRPHRSLGQHAPSASDTTADVELAKLRRTDAWEGSFMRTGWVA
jgi:hypothetical protein